MKKKGVVAEYLPWLILAVVVLVILMIVIFSLSEQGGSLISRIKDLFR